MSMLLMRGKDSFAEVSKTSIRYRSENNFFRKIILLK